MTAACAIMHVVACDDPSGTDTISMTELRAALDRGDELVLVEALGAAYFADAHLPGAVNIPADRVDDLAPDVVPDQESDIVVYCSGACASSEIAADRLRSLGYRKVRVYLGGKEEWVEHGLPVQRSSD